MYKRTTVSKWQSYIEHTKVVELSDHQLCSLYRSTHTQEIVLLNWETKIEIKKLTKSNSRAASFTPQLGNRVQVASRFELIHLLPV